MNQSEKSITIDIIHGCAELLNRQLSTAAIGLYLKALEDLDFHEVSYAFSDCVRNKRFFPSPAEIRELVMGPPETLEDTALIEATKVLNAIRRIGSHSSVVFDDPVTMAVIQQHSGGWERLNDLTEQEVKFWMKDWQKAYATFARAGLKSYGVLYGSIDRDNSAKGIDIENHPPVMIGDQDKAMKVWRGENKGDLIAMTGESRVSRLLEKIGISTNTGKGGMR
jgi:hypothetical protein